MYEDREIFQNAPLEFVAAEVRYPYAPRLRTPSTQDRLIELMGETFPIAEPDPGPSWSLAASSSTSNNHLVLRALDEAGTASVTVGLRSLAVETTAYTDFPSFLKLFDRTLTAFHDVRAVTGVERVGLRYIDEIRVPKRIEKVTDWKDWVNPALISMGSLIGGYPATWGQAVVRYDTAENQKLLFRVAALSGKSVVDDTHLHRRKYSEGPFFLLDIDSYWRRGEKELLAFTPSELVSILERLHIPAGRVFQSAITENLKQDVLRAGAR